MVKIHVDTTLESCIFHRIKLTRKMVKLFVGNLGDSYEVTSNDLRLQFEKYGSVTECERIKNYAFVHMEDATAAEKALQELNGFVIKGKKA